MPGTLARKPPERDQQVESRLAHRILGLHHDRLDIARRALRVDHLDVGRRSGSKAMIVIFNTSFAVCAAVARWSSARSRAIDRRARDAHFGSRLDLHLLQRQLRRLEDRLALTAQARALPAFEDRLRQLQRQRPGARRLEESGRREQLRPETSRPRPATNPCGCR